MTPVAFLVLAMAIRGYFIPLFSLPVSRVGNQGDVQCKDKMRTADHSEKELTATRKSQKGSMPSSAMPFMGRWNKREHERGDMPVSSKRYGH